MKRRDFVKTLGATGVALYASDLVGDLIAQSPKARVLRVAVQGPVGHRARRSQAARLHLRRHPLHPQRQRQRRPCATASSPTAFGFGAGGHEESAGFGVRVIHSGVWGFASSPFVTEDEIKKITAQATEVAKASAVSKRFEVKLAPVEAYTDYWAVPVKVEAGRRVARRQDRVPDEDQRGGAEAARRHARAVEHGVRLRVEVPRHLRRLVHRAGNLAHLAELHRDGAQGRQGQVAHLHGGAEDGRLRSGARRPRCSRTSSASAREAVEHCTAPPVGVGLKDLIMTPVARDADDSRDRRPRRPSSIASSATRPTTPARAS